MDDKKESKMGDKLGPLEWVIIGNGGLLLLLFSLLLYMICRLRSLKRDSSYKDDPHLLDSPFFGPTAPHQTFSTLCGLPPSATNSSSSPSSSPNMDWTPTTLSRKNKDAVESNLQMQFQPLWIALPTPPPPTSHYGTLQLPNKKTKVKVPQANKCARVHSCRVLPHHHYSFSNTAKPSFQFYPPPPPPIPICTLPSSSSTATLQKKKLNVDFANARY